MGLVARRADDLPVWVLSVTGSGELRRVQRVLELYCAPTLAALYCVHGLRDVRRSRNTLGQTQDR
jgi:hypothetical protein